MRVMVMEVQSWLATGMSCSSKPVSLTSPKLSSSDRTSCSEMQSTSTIIQDTSFSSTESNLSLQVQTTPSLFSNETTKPSFSYHCITSLKTLTPQISCLAVHDNTLYAASINEINVFDSTNYILIDTFNSDDPTSGLVKSIAFGKGMIFTAHQDCKIRVWQVTPTKRHRLLSTIPTVKDRLRHCLLPKSYVQVRRHKKQLWVEHADTVSGLFVNEGFLYSVSWDKSFKVWKMSDLRCLESVKAHQDAVNAVAVSSDGTVFTASADGRIKVWERSYDGERRHALKSTLQKHKSTVNALALNGDGSVLFSGGCDHVIVVWEKESGSSTDNYMVVKWSLIGHAGPVLCLIYVDDLLFSGSSDRTVRIWQLGSTECGYRCLAVLEGHLRPVKSLVAVSGGVSHGGISVCSGSLDGEIRVWQITAPSLNNSFETLESERLRVHDRS